MSSSIPPQFLSDINARLDLLTNTLASIQKQLSTQSNGHSNGNGLPEAIAAQIERESRITREDFTGKLGSLISPYLDSVLRRCTETEQRQAELEERFKAHEKAVRASAGEMEGAFVKMRKEAAKDFKAQRDQMQKDLEQVNKFVTWFRTELEKAGDTLTEVRLAAGRCQTLVDKIDTPSEEIVRHLEEVRSQGEKEINHAALHLKKTYQNLREPILSRVTWTLAGTALAMMIMVGFGIWVIRSQVNRSEQAIAEYGAQQQENIRGLLDKSLEEAKEAQIGNEIKVKMWDALLKSLPPQQQTALIEKYREQVNDAERKRIDDQMSSSYDQMYNKKKK